MKYLSSINVYKMCRRIMVSVPIFRSLFLLIKNTSYVHIHTHKHSNIIYAYNLISIFIKYRLITNSPLPMNLKVREEMRQIEMRG